MSYKKCTELKKKNPEELAIFKSLSQQLGTMYVSET